MRDTIILCFRDLVTAPGDTISRHSELVREFGYCWWGWWKKAIEDVPVDLLLRIVGSNGGKNAEIFLYDCGSYKFYKVTTGGVSIAPSDTGMSAPEIEKTPEYYANLKCGAWFKFKNISEVVDGLTELRKMKYLDFPSWRRESTHEAFKGQNVASFEELDAMQVTFWHVELGE